MKTSIATVSISGNLREKLEAIAAAGFDGIEIFEQDFLAHDGSPKEVGAMVRDHGLEIMLFQPFRDFETLPEPFRGKAFDRAERKFEVMQELGTDLVLICSSVHPKALGGIDRAADDLAELGERAAKRDLRIGYEALAWGRHVNDHRDAWEIVRRADHPSVGLIVDSFHTLGRKLDPNSLRSVPGDKIFFVQLADAPAIDMDLLYWSRHFRNMPGEGDLDVTGFMQAVKATGYSGPISLEIFNDMFRGGNTRQLARDGYRSLIDLMDQVARAEPELSLSTPPVPAPQSPDGVAFIEFATRGKEAEALQSLLEQLGFTLTGTHRNKAVSLWQQGETRIVLNKETEGHAASSWNARGTNVCDIGISVQDAADVITRAEKLGDNPFGQPLGPGEASIPAIKGLAGSVLHFMNAETAVQEVWQSEFVASNTEPGNAGLTRIDHIAQTMSYEDMLSWSLFYSTLFEMKKSAMVDVVDPDGIVRSQALETMDGKFRITLNGADTHRTIAGAFLSETFGASVQHIAFATDDIFGTLQTLIGNGFKPLPISSNYYADLEARFVIDPELLKRMKSMNVLYDEDESGSFFQCYSEMTGFGVFFEIVQRQIDYAGYGGANAPFRIAAQKRMVRPKGVPAN